MLLGIIQSTKLGGSFSSASVGLKDGRFALSLGLWYSLLVNMIDSNWIVVYVLERISPLRGDKRGNRRAIPFLRCAATTRCHHRSNAVTSSFKIESSSVRQLFDL